MAYLQDLSTVTTTLSPTISISANIEDIYEHLSNENVPVIIHENNQFIGIIHREEAFCALRHSLPIQEVINRKIATVSEAMPLHVSLELCQKNDLDYLILASEQTEKAKVVSQQSLRQAVISKDTESEKLTHVLCQNRRLLEAVKIAKLGCWELDIQQNELWWSAEIFNLFNLDPNHFQPSYQAFLDAIHPEDRDIVDQAYSTSIANKTPYDITHRLLLKNGEIKYVNEVCHTEYDEGGKPIRSIGTVQDITETYHSNQREKLFAKVIENSHEGVVITDKNANIIAVNEALTDIVGYSREDVLGKNPRLWRSERNPAEFFTKMWHSLVTKGSWHSEIWNKKKSGEIFPALQRINSIYNEQGELTHYIGTFLDITEFKKSQQLIEYQTHHDALTGLANGRSMVQIIDKALSQGSEYSLVCIAVDNFKHINESFNHDFGDHLLKQIAKRLTAILTKGMRLSRVSGDVFAILMPGEHKLSGAKLAQIRGCFERKFTVKNHDIFVSVSIGIASSPNDTCDGTQLLQCAESAMFHAKQQGRNTACCYTEHLTAGAFEQVLLKSALHNAVANNELFIVYQPQFNTQNGKLIGLEALLRWEHPTLGIISPAKFIPIAEETGLIIPIGEWVINQVCQQAVKWLKQKQSFGKVAINIAGQQLRSGKLVNLIEHVLAKTGLPAEHLELEITESFIMQQSDRSVAQLNSIRNLGVSLSIDDFGTGYSSLSYLKKLPIDKLKIDKSFVDQLPDDKDDIAIINAIVRMGKSLGLTIIAEGIENKAQADFLASIDCDEVQGFYFAKPMPLKKIEVLLN